MHTCYNPEVVSSELTMKKEIYLAAATGSVEFLNKARLKDIEAVVAEYSDDDLLGLTSHGNNIIHIAAEHGHLDFIDEALKIFDATHQRKLIIATNNDGDTPLHMATKLQTRAVAELLVGVVSPSSCPWRIQNNMGNSPLHLALMNGGKSIQVADYLLEVGPEVASYTNHRKETPLHLAVDYDNQGAEISMKNMMNTINGLGASLDYTKSLFERDSLSIIKKLLKKTTTICCLRDHDGMTPLLRATVNCYISAIKVIIDYCPESVEICDLWGKTFLHHMQFSSFLEAREFLRIPGIPPLMDRQDRDKNTPLHMAIMNCDYNMVRAMIECNANFAIKNKEGNTPAALIQSNSSSFLDKTEYIRQSTKRDEVMPKELFAAACNGNWQGLLDRLKEPAYEKQFLSRLPDGSNILHVAFLSCEVDYEAKFNDYSNDENNYSSQLEDFIVKAPKKYPILLCQTDSKGCTPLHHAMLYKALKPGGKAFKKMLDNLKHIKGQRSSFPLPPWEAKDIDGNTVLHVALRYSRFEMAKFLIEITDAKLVGQTNNSKETPLHYLCRYNQVWLSVFARIMMGKFKDASTASIAHTLKYAVDVLIEKDCSGVYTYDADGFTPLLRAVQSWSTMWIAERIIDHYPESIRQVDSHLGRNLFHLADLRSHVHREFIKTIKPETMKSLISQVDRQGNLPLHLALQDRRFDTAEILMSQHKELHELHAVWYNMANNDGKKPFNTINYAPNDFKRFLSSKNIDVDEGEKSLYNVPYSKMKDFMGTIGVVAALLATITFTAAFTVPGGYEQNNGKINGSPIFAKRVAFQVFMFTDVIGMCSSIMSLICLIWFFTSSEGKKIGWLPLDEGPALGDLSMGFLQLSFYSTLVAFMTGVYVTTLPEVQWLAISTCVICCLVLLLMRRFFIIHFWINVFAVIFMLNRVLKIAMGQISLSLSLHWFKWVGRHCCKSSAREANSE